MRWRFHKVVERESEFIRVGVGITCGAAASHGRGHLTPSPPNAGRSDSRFCFSRMRSSSLNHRRFAFYFHSRIVFLSLCHVCVCSPVRAVSAFCLSSLFCLFPSCCVCIVYKTCLRNFFSSYGSCGFHHSVCISSPVFLSSPTGACIL